MADRQPVTVTIQGASDDLIEIGGTTEEEYGYDSYTNNGDGDLLAFSDGTLLRIRHDQEGIWRITPLAPTRLPGNSFELAHCNNADPEGSDDYTDIATLTGDIRWVSHGHTYTKIGH